MERRKDSEGYGGKMNHEGFQERKETRGKRKSWKIYEEVHERTRAGVPICQPLQHNASRW